MIKITTTAQEYIKSIITGDTEITKLAMGGGGCSGFQYNWDIIQKDQIDDMSDELIEFEGGGLVIDGMSLMYLFGSVIDLESGLMGTKLIITNPQVTSSCGCGESVNIDTDAVNAACSKQAAQNEDLFFDPTTGPA